MMEGEILSELTKDLKNDYKDNKKEMDELIKILRWCLI